ncbi:MAG TPA: TetR/AcrR family transcriptional regulator, partial [Thermoanaerobaculia bacterium]|nr:TetR/AcrR family transcriptional regulator [Thermoanaerobaculia bacterium]
MSGQEPPTTHSARDRLLASGKALFARLGYEQASTSAIAREAGTSESQLVRYFGSKSGLLEAIFNESWSSLTEQIAPVAAQAPHSREAFLRILNIVLAAFNRDHDLASIFLFEGRRVRGHDVALSKGFLSFYELVHQLIRKGQEDGSFRADISVDILGAALLGCAEGMMRDRIIAE